MGCQIPFHESESLARISTAGVSDAKASLYRQPVREEEDRPILSDELLCLARARLYSRLIEEQMPEKNRADLFERLIQILRREIEGSDAPQDAEDEASQVEGRRHADAKAARIQTFTFEDRDSVLTEQTLNDRIDELVYGVRAEGAAPKAAPAAKTSGAAVAMRVKEWLDHAHPVLKDPDSQADRRASFPEDKRHTGRIDRRSQCCTGYPV